MRAFTDESGVPILSCVFGRLWHLVGMITLDMKIFDIILLYGLVISVSCYS